MVCYAQKSERTRERDRASAAAAVPMYGVCPGCLHYYQKIVSPRFQGPTEEGALCSLGFSGAPVLCEGAGHEPVNHNLHGGCLRCWGVEEGGT